MTQPHVPQRRSPVRRALRAARGPLCVVALLTLPGCVDGGVAAAADDESPGGGDGASLELAPERGGPGSAEERESVPESPSLASILAIEDPGSVSDGVADIDRVRRLTRDEYQRSASDLLGIDASARVRNLPNDQPTLDGYYAAVDLPITDRLVAELEGVAEALAEAATNDEQAYAGLVECAAFGPQCRDEFLRTTGLRAYRRPLTESELSRYRELFDQGGSLMGSGDAFRAGVRISLEAMLQSPSFLFHIERGSGVIDQDGELLGEYEVASRLSFALWGSLPDAALLEAARRSELSTPEDVDRQAQRLVDDERVSARIVDYHQRWLQLESLTSAEKDLEVFPGYSPELTSSMLAESRRFVREVTLSESGALRELLTATYGFADARLASHYGLDLEDLESEGLDLEGLAFDAGSALLRFEHDPEGPRGGILTQAAFLSGQSSSSNRTSPILRGVFVLRRLLCQDIPDPPPNAQSTEPPPSATPIVTTRDFFEWKTSMSQCRGCHDSINPIGFGFEDFDAVGQYRSEEAGEPIDARGAVQIGTQRLEFEGARELSAAIAELPEAHACYARNWLRYLWGRPDTDADLRTLSRLRLGLGTPGYGVRQLLLDATAAAAFRHVRPLPVASMDGSR